MVSDITPEVRNAIAYYNGGIDSETGLKIEATVIENGGKINAAPNDKLHGLFLSKPGFTSADAITAQKQYMDCLDKRASKDKASSIDTCQAKLTCEIDTLQMACNCRNSISGIAAEKRLSEASKNKLLTDNCYSGQYDFRKFWGGAVRILRGRPVPFLCNVKGENYPQQKREHVLPKRANPSLHLACAKSRASQ